MPNLLDLPDELLIGITGCLYYASDVNALSQTCRRLWQVADPLLYARVSPSSINLEHVAAKGNTDALRRLFSENEDFLPGREEPSPYLLQHHLRPFFTAMTKGHLNVAYLLVEFYGAMVVDIRDPRKTDSLLYSAIKGGHCDVIRYLLDVGSPPDRRGCFWPKSPHLLNFIGRCCPTSFFKSLVEDPRTDINATEKSGRPLIWQMIEYGKVELVQVLLDAGADPLLEYQIPVDMGRPNGITEITSQLKHAILRGKEDIARLFLERGAYGDLKKGLKPKILSQMMERSGPSLPWLVLEKIPEPWLYCETTDDMLCILNIAAANGNMHLVRRILNECSIKEENPCFETAIGFAAQYGHIDVVQCLLPPGLPMKDVEAPPAYMSAMVGACKGMQLHVIDLLLDRVGPKLWTFLTDSRYSIIRGDIGGNQQFSSYLLEKNAFDLSRTSPTDLKIEEMCETAMDSENFPLLEYFLAQIGIPCPGSSERGIGCSWRFEAIMQEALVLGSSDVFQFILDKGFHLDPTDPAWQNLAIIAVSWNRFEAVEYFLNNGFDINTRCRIYGLAGESGWTHKAESELEVNSDRKTYPYSETVWYGTMLEAAMFWLALPCFTAGFTTEEESSAKSKSTKMVQMLCDRGADIYTVNSEGEYLFEILIQFGGSTAILNELLLRGVSPLTPVKSVNESLLAYAFRLLPKNASSKYAELLVQHFMRLDMSCEDFRSLIPPQDEKVNRNLKRPLFEWKLNAEKRMWRHYWRMKYPVEL